MLVKADFSKKSHLKEKLGEYKKTKKNKARVKLIYT